VNALHYLVRVFPPFCFDCVCLHMLHWDFKAILYSVVDRQIKEVEMN